LSVYYCDNNGRPGVPIRLIVGINMLRQTYKGELKQLMTDQRFHDNLRCKKKALATRRGIKVIESKVFRDLERKMTEAQRLN